MRAQRYATGWHAVVLGLVRWMAAFVHVIN